MATNARIFEVRMLVKDPLGFTGIIEVANAAALPASPVAQALYFLTDVKEYHAMEDGAWTRQDVVLADARISTLCDLYENVNQVASKVINDLVSHYGQLLALAYKAHDDGSESFDKQTLSDFVSFYKGLKASFDAEVNEASGTSTGRYFRTKKPVIGGML